METYGGISSEEYIENENALLLLIHPTKSRDFLRGCTSRRATAIKKEFKEVFGQKPNRKNLSKFFQHEYVQKLWFSSAGFVRSKELQEILRGLTRE